MSKWEYERIKAEEAEYKAEMQEFFDRVDAEIRASIKGNH